MKITVDHQTSSKTVAEAFSESASMYHQKAEVQQKVAQGLISSLLPWKNSLPEGPILEIGCGTGFLSEQLIKEFPGRNIELTDISEGMLRFCKERLDKEHLLNSNASFYLLDADEIQPEEERYSLITSNFTAQWFKDTAMSLERLSGLLKPGGLLLCSFPGNHSFEEWHSNCLELGLPFTANPLPDVEEVIIKLSLNPLQIDYYEDDLYQEFEHSIDFFKHLKEIGASVSETGKQLNPKQLRLLTNFWDDKTSNNVKVKWHVVYLAAKKEYS